MKFVIVDGTLANDPVCQHLLALAEGMQMQVSHFALADIKMAPCLGDFECWIKTPGRCRTNDGARDIAHAMHDADLVVFLAPISFGGYSAELKKGVDRLIGLVHPYFHDRDGLTRHMPRYQRYPPILFVGIADGIDDETASTYRELAAGNAINLIAPSYFTCIISQGAHGWQETVEEALSRAMSGGMPISTENPGLEGLIQACLPSSIVVEGIPQSVVVLVGSARPKGTSTSELLARRLITGMERTGIDVKVVYASSFIKVSKAAEEAIGEMLAADMLVIAAPLYVDGLPYLVVSALEQVSARLARQPHQLSRVAGILNCGYPEAVHNRIAMRMLGNFARQNRLAWMGGLALGGGEVLQGRLRGFASIVARHAFRALGTAADSLARGDGIPVEAIRLMTKPLVSPGFFRRASRIRWWLMARSHGVTREQLSDRPWEDRSQAAS